MPNRTLFDRPEFASLHRRWQARQAEFSRLESYYDGSVYGRARDVLGRLDPRLASAIRPLYLPVARAVNVDAGIVPGGWKLAPGCERLAPAVRQALTWSEWDREGVLYVHYGALYGCVGLRVSDLRAQGRVRLAPVDPCQFLLVGDTLYDETPRLAVVIQRRAVDGSEPWMWLPGGPVPSGAPDYEYAEVITPDAVRTFANGEPRGFGRRAAEYSNALGFVPLVQVPHIHTGRPRGDCAFEKVIPMLDEVNRLATDLADVIHRYRDPQYAIAGAEASDLRRDSESIWFLPEGARPEILVAQLNIPGTLTFLQDIRKQVEKGMPELAFDELSSKELVATATVELQLLELVFLIQRVRPNYDGGLAQALRMAGRAAADLGASALEPLAAEDWAFDSARPVLPLDANSALDLELKRLQVQAAGSREHMPPALQTAGHSSGGQHE